MMQTTTTSLPIDYDDAYEYHGSTTVERTRRKQGRVVWKEWLIFDTVEEASLYFNEAH